MPLVLADRVKVVTSTTGTGTLTLGAAATGFRDFSVIGNGNETYYTIVGGTQWEVGIGTYSSTGPTLTRSTILASSNANAVVNLSAGNKDVFVTYPSGRSVVSLTGNGSEFAATTRMIFAQTTAPTGWTKDTTNYNNHALRVVIGTASTGGTVDFTTAFASQTPSGNVTTSVTATTGQVAQAGNVTVTATTGQVAQGGNVATTITAATQGGNVTGTGTIGPTTLAVPTIPGHTHPITGLWQNAPSSNRFTSIGITGAAPAAIWVAGAAPPAYPGTPNTDNSTGGGGAHTHPATITGFTFTGQPHTHPATSTFTGAQHAHPVSAPATFTGAQHAHPVSAPATSSFTGNAINLAVKYLDVITATKN